MPGRPEGNDGGYDAVDPVDETGWQEFTAWRPSSGTTASSANETDHGAWRGGPVDRGGYGWGVGRSRRTDRGTAATPDTNTDPGRPPAAERRGFRWTEDQPTRYAPGQRVESTQATGGLLGGRTAAGTTGKIEGIETGLFGDERMTVRFDNGYTETVTRDEIKPRSWW